MKILTVSDYVVPALYDHFKAERFPGIDLILSCGDLPAEYLSFLVTMFNVPLFYVCGNHDVHYDQNPPEGCVNVDGKVVVHRGLRILGLEGSHWYNGKPHQYTQRQMWRKIRKVRLQLWRKGGVDLIMTHAPPRHIHDAEDICHQGFESFCWLIDRYAPRYFLHGHMHFTYTTNARRITVVKETRVINSYGYYILEIADS